MSLRIYLLDRFAATNPVYSTWMDHSPYPCEIVRELPNEWEIPDDAGIIITHQHYQWETISCLRRVLEAGKVPVLILSDGVLEFRNTWQNPTIADGSIFQPLFGHKLACLGRAPARIVESLGNPGKCEIVGHPRFDNLFRLESLPTPVTGPFRLLVTTARTPAFTSWQHQQLVAGLKELKRQAAAEPLVDGRPLEISWRLSDSLRTEIGLPPASLNQPDPSLSDAIDLAHAVITTPSSVFLESVIKRRPTAILDFTNSPSYVIPAWTISAPTHFRSVLAELAQPPASKMQFQRMSLRDQVELGTDSRQRLFTLIREMVNAGFEARRNNQPMTLPDRILSDPQRGIFAADNEFDLQSLYPDSKVHAAQDVNWLRQELAHAIARLGQLPRDLQQKNDLLDFKGKHIEAMESELEYAESRIAEGHQRERALADTISQKIQDLDRKSDHIEQLHQLLRQSTDELRAVRQSMGQLKSHLHYQANQLSNAVRQLTNFPVSQLVVSGSELEAAEPGSRKQVG